MGTRFTIHRASGFRPGVHASGYRRGEVGLTLIELLVVITILGILAAIVVFSVGGITNDGQIAAVSYDAGTLRTAEESDCAENGYYTTPAQLKSDGFLASLPTYNSIILYSGGTCTSGSQGSGIANPDTTEALDLSNEEASGFLVGSAAYGSGSTSGPVVDVPNFLPNTTTSVMNFLQSAFVNSGNGAFQLNAGSPTMLETSANTATNDAVAFFAANEYVADETISTANGGSCSSNCLGIPSSLTEYALPQLIVYSCASGGQAIAPNTSGSTACTPPGGPSNNYLSISGASPAPFSTPTTVAQLLVLLEAPGSTFTLAIAQNGMTNPTGQASVAALESANNQVSTTVYISGSPVTMTPTKLNSTMLSELEAGTYPGNTAKIIVNTGGGGSPEDLVLSGSVDAAMFTSSSVESPAAWDTNNWYIVSTTLYPTSDLAEYAVLLNKSADFGAGNDPNATAQAFLNDVVTHPYQAALSAYGFTPLS